MALQFFIKNLCNEIQEECKKLDQPCNQNFMTYYLSLLAYDPLWNLHPKMNDIDRTDALRLIKYVVRKMGSQICPCLVTLKLQFYFQCNFEDKLAIVLMHQRNLNARLRPLVEEIIEAKPETEAEFDLLWKQIIYYSTIWCGLGNPLHHDVYRETYYAFTSFFDKSDLNSFLAEKSEDRIGSLADIASILAGVRIFNWTTDIGGVGIQDLPKYLGGQLACLKDMLTKDLSVVMNNIDVLTSAMDYCFVIEEKVDEATESIAVEYQQACELPSLIEYEDIEHFKDMLVLCRQSECFFRQLMEATLNVQANFEAISLDFKNCLDEFHALTNLKAGVPTRVIFPLFMDLSKIWSAFQREIFQIERLLTIEMNLNLYCKELALEAEKLQDIIDDRDILTDEDRIVEVDEEEYVNTDLFGADCIWPHSERFNLQEMHFEFLGFDVWRLVESQGGLIPGNPYIGIINHKDKHYIFSCKNSAYMFTRNPERFINEALELARKKVEFINLLNLQEQLSEVQTIKQLCSDMGLVDLTSTRITTGIQTETHPVESAWVKNYRWNIWDYKRQALKMCNISAAKTVQVNSDQTMGKVMAAVQTYDQCDVEIQTMKDNYTNTSKPLTYFFGLRGRKDDKQFILDLTKPPDKS